MTSRSAKWAIKCDTAGRSDNRHGGSGLWPMHKRTECTQGREDVYQYFQMPDASSLATKALASVSVSVSACACACVCVCLRSARMTSRRSFTGSSLSGSHSRSGQILPLGSEASVTNQSHCIRYYCRYARPLLSLWHCHQHSLC